MTQQIDLSNLAQLKRTPDPIGIEPEPKDMPLGWQVLGTAIVALGFALAHTPQPPVVPMAIASNTALRDATRAFQPEIEVVQPEPINITIEAPEPPPQPSVNEIASQVAEKLKAQQPTPQQPDPSSYQYYLPQQYPDGVDPRWVEHFRQMNDLEFETWPAWGQRCRNARVTYEYVQGLR